MAKIIKKNRFAAVIVKAEDITARGDYIIYCTDCGESKSKSMDILLTTGQKEMLDNSILPKMLEYIAAQEGAEIEE